MRVVISFISNFPMSNFPISPMRVEKGLGVRVRVENGSQG